MKHEHRREDNEHWLPDPAFLAEYIPEIDIGYELMAALRREQEVRDRWARRRRVNRFLNVLSVIGWIGLAIGLIVLVQVTLGWSR